MHNINNKVLITGHLGQEPTLKQFETGNDGYTRKMASFSVATNESYTNNVGKKIEHTYWHLVVAWGEMAEKVEKNLHKGNKIALEGKLTTRNYKAKDGTPRYVTEIVLNEFELVPKTEKQEA